MSLRDELLGTAEPTPRGCMLLVPPDWGRFVADDAGRDQLVELMRQRFLMVHRPDLFGEARAAVHRQWEQLRERGTIQVYLPIAAPVEGGTPMSVVTVPWIAQGEFAEDVRRRPGACSSWHRSCTPASPRPARLWRGSPRSRRPFFLSTDDSMPAWGVANIE
ncbi:hypothetical protein [Microbacterium sp. XT11]|uniref:hypothetical protein n=1 Tax=Microbacterium sp. XT11 TaxID=367477 RepID=UPI00082AFF68|nr:hypothetical protein [Microbacterium sp. XT11]